MNSLVELISGIYQQFGLGSANNGDLWGILAVLFITFSAITFLLRSSAVQEDQQSFEQTKQTLPLRDNEAPAFETEIKDVHIPTDEKIDLAIVEKEEGPTWKERLTKGFARSRSEVWGKLENIFSKEKLDDDVLDEVEEILYTADIGPTTAAEIIDELRERSKKPDFNSAQFKVFLYDIGKKEY